MRLSALLRTGLTLARRRLRWLVRPPAVRGVVPRLAPGALAMNEAEEQAAVEAVREVIRGRRLYRYSPNPLDRSRVERLEAAFAGRMGAEHAVAVNSGTSALVCALAAMGVGPGDEVIVPAYTWFSSVSSVLAVGAVPVVAEVDASLTLDPADVERRLSPHTKAIVAVHMRGAPAALDRLGVLAGARGLRLLEDAAQAVGGNFHGRPLGSIGDAGAFSFQQSKMMTAGEGGMVVTSDPALHRRTLMYHDAASPAHFGITADEWLPGLNLRMTELQAAVLLVQLERLDELVASTRAHKARLKELVGSPLAERGVGFRGLNDPDGETGVALVFFLSDAAAARRVVSALANENVPASRLYQELQRLPHDGTDLHVYPGWAPLLRKRVWSAGGGPWRDHPREIDYAADACPATVGLLSRAVHVDVSPGLTAEQVEQVGTAIVTAVAAET